MTCAQYGVQCNAYIMLWLFLFPPPTGMLTAHSSSLGWTLLWLYWIWVLGGDVKGWQEGGGGRLPQSSHQSPSEQQVWWNGKTSGRSWQAETNTAALVAVRALNLMVFFFHASKHACGTDEATYVVSPRHHNSEVVCCVITECLRAAHETSSLCLSLTHCAQLLHISPGGEQHRSEDHITEVESCSSRLTDPSFPPLL